MKKEEKLEIIDPVEHTFAIVKAYQKYGADPNVEKKGLENLYPHIFYPDEYLLLSLTGKDIVSGQDIDLTDLCINEQMRSVTHRMIILNNICCAMLNGATQHIMNQEKRFFNKDFNPYNLEFYDASSQDDEIAEIKPLKLPREIIEELDKEGFDDDDVEAVAFILDHESATLRHYYKDTFELITGHCIILIYAFIEENLKKIRDDCACFEAGYNDEKPLYNHVNSKLLKEDPKLHRSYTSVQERIEKFYTQQDELKNYRYKKWYKQYLLGTDFSKLIYEIINYVDKNFLENIPKTKKSNSNEEKFRIISNNRRKYIRSKYPQIYKVMAKLDKVREHRVAFAHPNRNRNFTTTITLLDVFKICKELFEAYQYELLPERNYEWAKMNFNPNSLGDTAEEYLEWLRSMKEVTEHLKKN